MPQDRTPGRFSRYEAADYLPSGLLSSLAPASPVELDRCRSGLIDRDGGVAAALQISGQ